MIKYLELYTRDAKSARFLLVKSYEEKSSISETARIFKTTRNTVRKAIQRYEREGEAGLVNRSRRPKHSPRQTPAGIEGKVLALRKKTNFGPLRLHHWLKANGLTISPSTIRNILRRNGMAKRRRKKSFISKWVNWYDWDKIYPLQYFQLDTKEILDFKTLPEEIYLHILDHGLPRIQWTAIDIKTRLRFIAYSQEKSYANGVTFMILLALWLKAFGITHEIYFQTDWGEEFGGKSYTKINHLQDEILKPLDVRLVRIPKGKKEYNGIVERSHRTDDEEFYLTQIKKISCAQDFPDYAAWWLWCYNTKRKHHGKGMNFLTPFERVKLDYPQLHKSFALFPPVDLDSISSSSYWKGGQYVLAPYIFLLSPLHFFHAASGSKRRGNLIN